MSKKNILSFTEVGMLKTVYINLDYVAYIREEPLDCPIFGMNSGKEIAVKESMKQVKEYLVEYIHHDSRDMQDVE